MKALILLVISLNSFAITCDVYNYKDAINCIKKHSYIEYSEGEMEHSIGASKTEESKKAFEVMTGVKPKTTYVGVVEVHYDEDQLLYYEIERGTGISPKLVLSYNIVDLMYDYDGGIYQDLDIDELPKEKIEEIEKNVSLHIPYVGTMNGFHVF